MELKSKIRFRSLLFFDLELEGDPMKKFIKWLLERPCIKGVMRFYMASESDITSIAVAYYLLISILPLLLIAANILPYFKIRPTQILLTLREVLPASMYRIVLQVISSVLTKPSTGLLSFSIISALWVSSQCIAYLQRAFNKSYGVEKERGIIWSRIFSVLISFALQGLFGLSLLLTMFGRMIIRSVYQFFEFDESLYIRLLTITGPSVYLLLFLTLLMLYYTLPNIKIPKFRYVFPGAIFVTVILYVTLNIFWKYVDRYITNFLDARFFGSVLLAVIMFWFILVAKVLIIGCILNASVQYAIEAKFETRDGDVVAKYQSSRVAFHQKKSSFKRRFRLKKIGKKPEKAE